MASVCQAAVKSLSDFSSHPPLGRSLGQFALFFAMGSQSIPQFAVGAKKLFMEDATLAALTYGNIIIISAIYIFLYY